MFTSRLLMIPAVVGLTAVCSLSWAEDKKAIFKDDFNRADADAVGQGWTSRGEAVLKDKAALFKLEEDEFRPRISVAITADLRRYRQLPTPPQCRRRPPSQAEPKQARRSCACVPLPVRPDRASRPRQQTRHRRLKGCRQVLPEAQTPPVSIR